MMLVLLLSLLLAVAAAMPKESSKYGYYYYGSPCKMNNYIVRSYRGVIVITKFATTRASKAQSIVMY